MGSFAYIPVFLCLLMIACTSKLYPTSLSPKSDKFYLQTSNFDELPGWQSDAVAHATLAYKQSCLRLEKKDPLSNHSRHEYTGKTKDWLPSCAALETIEPENNVQARAFFEEYFTPYQVLNHDETEGLFTGYYEPLLQGSFEKTDRFSTPLYKRPPDLVMVDLGDFREELKGQRIAGRIDTRARLIPYEDRATIDYGALDNKNLEILWVSDPVAAFFLHIQGSGRIAMPDGSFIRLGYDGQNGHPYKAIGKELIERGELTKDNVSLQTIREWLENNPNLATEITHLNPSYVFFKVLEGAGPLGGEAVPLTAGRSLAIDYTYLPYGAPIFIKAEHPLQKETTFSRLMIAQDTGGAIRGPIRGDVFWGFGEKAELVAGQMKSKGEKWLLLPKTVVPSDKLKPLPVKKESPLLFPSFTLPPFWKF